MKPDLNKLLIHAKKAVVDANAEVLKIYKTADFSIEVKKDNSPLTLADTHSHQAIVKELSKTQIPILSEENIIPDFDTRSNWEYFWLVDPLDGTKEFIKQNGDFTVNIALIHNQKPILGVVSIPTEDKMYWATTGSGAFRQIANNKPEPISISARKSPVRITVSRSHLNHETEEYLKQFSLKQLIPAGSSKKILLIAEGSADIYPRIAPTMEWDMAATHIIAQEAGAKIYNFENKQEIKYNKPDLHNPSFIISN